MIQDMKLLDYTTDKGFLPHIKCADLPETVALLVDQLREASVVEDSEGLTHEILRREATDSTAIGGGLVLPHARFPGLKGVHLAAATLDPPLDMKAQDGLLVDVVILLVGPQGDPREMLGVLARLVRLVKDGTFLRALRVAGDATSMRRLFAAG